MCQTSHEAVSCCGCLSVAQNIADQTGATNGTVLGRAFLDADVRNAPSVHTGRRALFCGSYRARSSRRNSRDRIVSKAASAHNNTESMARVTKEGTLTARKTSAQQRTVTTNLGTLTLPTSRNLKALCPRR